MVKTMVVIDGGDFVMHGKDDGGDFVMHGKDDGGDFVMHGKDDGGNWRWWLCNAR